VNWLRGFRPAGWALILIACGGENDLESGQQAENPGAPAEMRAAPGEPVADASGSPPAAGPLWYADLPPELQTSLGEPWTGDLDGMIQRRTVRLLTVFSDVFYFLDGAEQKGITYEAAQLFEKRLNERFGSRVLKIQVLIVPVTRDRLIAELVEGRGDVAAANLTITSERQRLVDFSNPLMTGVNEILVTGPTAPPVESLDDLAGGRMPVRLSTSYYQSLLRLNDSLQARGLAPMEFIPLEESLEDADLLEMVNAGILDWVVVDTHMAEMWAQVLNQLTLRTDLALKEGGEIAWAFRKDSPQLSAIINEFVQESRAGTLLGNILIKRYFDNAEWVQSALGAADVERLETVLDPIRRYSAEFGFDWLMIGALGYQESRLDQNAKSDHGAVGVMQIMPSTAADVGISDIHLVDNNVHAGVKYLRYLRDRYFADEALTPLDQTLLTFASYNAGPRRVAGLRRQAVDLGLDPDVWFNNVEVVAAREIGRETVRYVGNIYKYYVAYRLIMDLLIERGEVE
jgi:membrane-bound lytic murein transglycosylase MltF